MDSKAPVTSMSASLLAREVYAVCFPERESVETLSDPLADIRRRFFTGGRKTAKAGKDQATGGYTGKLKGKMTGRHFYWKKMAGSVPAEESFDQRNGCIVVRRDMEGNITSRLFFDRSHIWIKSEYYDVWNANDPVVIFKPVASSDLVERFDWDAEKNRFRCTELYPLPYNKGSAEESILTARFGEPSFLVSSETGDFCYCPKQEAKERMKAQEEIQDGNVVLMPAWQVKDGSLSGEEGEEDSGISFTSLEEYAQVVPEKEVQPESAPAAPPEIGDTLEFSLNEVLEEAAEESPAEAQPAPVEEETSPEAPAAEQPVAEVTAPAEAAEKQPAVEETAPEETAEERPGAEETVTESPAEEPSTPPAPEQTAEKAVDEKIEEAAVSELTPVAQEETVPVSTGRDIAELEEIAERVLASQEEDSGPTVKVHVAEPAPEAKPAAPAAPAAPQPQAPAPAEEPQTAPVARQAIQIVNRSVSDLGHAAYDGEYVDGKREGFGAHYDKNGSLSYAGSWKNDRKDGLGVSFRSSDHALHIANWENGRPGSYVTLFDKNGNLRYSGKIIDGKKQGAGVAINPQDGTIFVGKWENGEPTGFGSSFDQDGNLLYYGNWENGKRSGHGTEFDANGAIIFDGEWKDGKYHNGILYQKQSDVDPEETPGWD